MAQTATPQFNLNEILEQVSREKDIDIDHWINSMRGASD